MRSRSIYDWSGATRFPGQKTLSGALLVALASVPALSPSASLAQMPANYVQNGDFSSHLDHWSVDAGDTDATTGTWPDNASGLYSGRILRLGQKRLEQCIQLREDPELEEPMNMLPEETELNGPWRVSFSYGGARYSPGISLLPRPALPGTVELRIWYYWDGACEQSSGSTHHHRVLFSPNTNYWPDWYRAARTFQIPPEVRSIRVSLLNMEGSGSIALVDEVEVSPGTVLYYFSFGDSFSAGTGTGNYIASPSYVPPFPDLPAPEGGLVKRHDCHRSPEAYAQLLSSTLEQNTGNALQVQLRHLACHGAVIQNFDRKQVSEPGQTTTLGRPTPYPTEGRELVTLTISGNDLGFDDVLRSCFTSDCLGEDGGYAFVSHARRRLWSQVEPDARRLFEELRFDRPNSTVVVLGYPQLFGASGAACVSLFGSGITHEEAEAVDDLALELDYALSLSAEAAGVHYLSVLDHFAGHGVCAAAQGIRALSHRIEESFHPNALGHQVYRDALQTYLGLNQSGSDLNLPPNPEPIPSFPCVDGLPPTEGGCVPEWWSYQPAPFLSCEGGSECDSQAVLSGTRVAIDTGLLAPELGIQFGGETIVTLFSHGDRYELARYSVTTPWSFERVVEVDIPRIQDSDPMAIIGVEFKPASWWLGDHPELPPNIGGMKGIEFIGSTDAVDSDGDGVIDYYDNCRFEWNPAQEDGNGDGEGDLCPTVDGLLFASDFEQGALAGWDSVVGN